MVCAHSTIETIKIAKLTKVALEQISKKLENEFFLNELPSSVYQECWVLNNQKVTINFEKTKEVKLDRLREKREILFEALDRQFTALISHDKDLTQIKIKMQQKEILRKTQDVKML